MSVYRSIESMPDLQGKKVLVRVDHNVTYDESKKLKDDRKIRATIPTLEFLVDKGAKLILMTHVGRPKGNVDEMLRTAPIAEHLKGLSDKFTKIIPVQELYGDSVEKEIGTLQPGEIIYLENVRFWPQEKEEEDNEHNQKIAGLAEYYVNEALPSLHTYEEASTCAVARKMQAFAGFRLLEEVKHLGTVLDDPRRPLVLIISGAKMKTKLPVVEYFLESGDDILLGGAVANTFIAARGFNIGHSKNDPSFIEQAQELMLESEKEDKAMIHVPRDAVLASNPESNAVDLPLEDIEGDMCIFDVGKVTVERYKEAIKRAGMIVWNGPLGMYEVDKFAGASTEVAHAVREATEGGAISILGGGDTVDFHTQYDLPIDCYSFVSTGGGAMLEFISGKTLPALEALKE
jgi:phosphoglycerate kinase